LQKPVIFALALAVSRLTAAKHAFLEAADAKLQLCDRLCILGVFQNPVGFGTRPAVFQAKARGLKSGETAFLSGSCSETEVSEQLYLYIQQYHSAS
jgi:hypothetical protein